VEADEDALRFVAVREVELVDVAARGAEAHALVAEVRGGRLEGVEEPRADSPASVLVVYRDTDEFDGVLTSRPSDGEPDERVVDVRSMEQLGVFDVPGLDGVAVTVAGSVAEHPVDGVEVARRSLPDVDHIEQSRRHSKKSLGEL